MVQSAGIRRGCCVCIRTIKVTQCILIISPGHNMQMSLWPVKKGAFRSDESTLRIRFWMKHKENPRCELA